MTTFTDGNATGNWNEAGNWDHGVPIDGESACIPKGLSATVGTGVSAIVSDLYVDGSLTVTSGTGSLTVTGNGLDGISTIAGSLSITGGGKVNLQNSQTTVSSDISFANLGVLNVANGFLTLGTDVDLLNAGGNGNVNIDKTGTLVIDSQSNTTAAQINVILNVGGLVTNTGAVDVNAGGAGAGGWKLGSGDTPDPVVTLTSNLELDGTVSDVDSGGLGHLVIATGGLLTQLSDTSRLDVYRLDITSIGGADGLDVNPPAASTTPQVNVSYVEQFGGIAEVDTAASFGNYTIHGGTTSANGVTWSIGYLHWGGGLLSGGTSAATFNVATLSLETQASDTADRQTTAISIDVAGTNTGNPMTDGSITLGAGDTLTLESGAHLQIGYGGGLEPDIVGTGTLINHGIIEKLQGTATGTRIQPTLKTADGQIWVTNASTRIYLDQPPVDALVGGVLSGTYIVDGELDVAGAVSQLSGQFQIGTFGKITDAGVDVASTTLASNAAGSTITVQSNATFAQNFTNFGVIDVQAGWSLTVSGGKTYTQAAGGVTKVNGTFAPTGGVTVSGGTLQGTGTVNGNVTNAFGGTVAPGNSPGVLTINGNFTNNGVLLEELNGPTVGTDYDQINVTGTAALGGQLILQRTGAYLPPNGQIFDAVTAANIVGTFGTITQFPASSDTWFDPSYSGTLFRLTANSASIGDATVSEGNAGTTDATFTISLGQAAPSAVSVDWATQDGTATAGSDYTAASGTVNFAPGETTKTVTVQVNGDTLVEPDENFAVNLSNPVGTRIRDGQGVGTITSDDSPPTATAAATVPPGDIDGFAVAPPPVQGKKVNLEPVSGKVRVKLPGSTKFVPLPDGEQVPVGTIVDATHGVVRLYSVGKNGRIQSAIFYEGVFQVTQKVGQALTTLKLVGGSFAACPKLRSASSSAKRRKRLSGKSSVRHLWGSGSGAFQTQGRYASAAIRGTKWLTDDRCNGTLIRVANGAVTVRDLTLKKTLALRAPKSYLAPAVKPKRKR